MRQCRECGATPCKGNSVYCRECYNAHSRARYAKAVMGESPPPKLCKCGRYYRVLGQNWCAACCREYHMEKKRRMTNVRLERRRGHVSSESHAMRGKVFCEGCARYLTPEHFDDANTPRCQLCQRADEYWALAPERAKERGLKQLKAVRDRKLRKFEAIFKGMGK